MDTNSKDLRGRPRFIARVKMETYTLQRKPINAYSSVESSILSLLDLVAEEPQKAVQIATGLIVVGVAILVLAAIFSS